jgi:hypothetical protein
MSSGYTLVQTDVSSKVTKMNTPDNARRKQLILIISRISTAVGNFSIQYNFQAISVGLIVMSVEECTLNEERCRVGKQADWVSGTATATVFAGAILGQLTVSQPCLSIYF